MITTTTQTSARSESRSLSIILAHSHASYLYSGAGASGKHRDGWTGGPERQEDRRTGKTERLMLIRSYRYTTGMVASVDPCHNSPVFILFPQRDFALYSLSPPIYPDVTRCPQHPRAFLQKKPKQLCLCLKFALPASAPHSH